MPLTHDQIKFLRHHAHPLKPVIIVGANGITDNLLVEVVSALQAHELIKIKVRAETHEKRAEIIEQLCQHTQAEMIQRIGHNLTLFLANKDKPKYHLPKQ